MQEMESHGWDRGARGIGRAGDPVPVIPVPLPRETQAETGKM